MMAIESFVLSLFGWWILYHLALAFLGINRSFKECVIPIIILALMPVITRHILKFTPLINTIALTILLIIALKFLGKLNWFQGTIGGLLSMITMTAGSMFLVAPMLTLFEIDVSRLDISHHKNNWILMILDLSEFTIPGLVLLILKLKNIALVKHVT